MLSTLLRFVWEYLNALSSWWLNMFDMGPRKLDCGRGKEIDKVPVQGPSPIREHVREPIQAVVRDIIEFLEDPNRESDTDSDEFVQEVLYGVNPGFFRDPGPRIVPEPVEELDLDPDEDLDERADRGRDRGRGRGSNPGPNEGPAVISDGPDYLVASKPPDVYINHDDPAVQTLATDLARMFPLVVDKSVAHSFRFVHRLDYSTSGVICLALNAAAAKNAGKAFSSRMTVKHYLAVVRGHVNIPCPFDVTAKIGVDMRPGHKHKMTTPDMQECEYKKKALTTFHMLGRGTFHGEPATLMLIAPTTGRRHQIRVHALKMGHPIFGDYTYADDTTSPRMYLHSFRLCFYSHSRINDAHKKNLYPSNCFKWLDFREDESFMKDVSPFWKETETLRDHNLLSDLLSSKAIDKRTK